MSTQFFFKILIFVCFATFAIPGTTHAAVMPSDSIADSRLAAHIIQRVTEIQNMDKTDLTRSEKNELKKELREMKQKADGLDKRVYLSIGAIIIIILLLILIL